MMEQKGLVLLPAPGYSQIIPPMATPEDCFSLQKIEKYDTNKAQHNKVHN